MPTNPNKPATDAAAFNSPTILLDRAPVRILRLKAVLDMVGLRRAALYRMKRMGLFPQSIKLGAPAVGWLEEDVQAWIAGRSNRRPEHLGREAGERTPPSPPSPSRRRTRAPSTATDEELRRLRAIARRVRRIHRLQAELARLLNESQEL